MGRSRTEEKRNEERNICRGDLDATGGGRRDEMMDFIMRVIHLPGMAKYDARVGDACSEC